MDIDLFNDYKSYFSERVYKKLKRRFNNLYEIINVLNKNEEYKIRNIKNIGEKAYNEIINFYNNLDKFIINEVKNKNIKSNNYKKEILNTSLLNLGIVLDNEHNIFSTLNDLIFSYNISDDNKIYINNKLKKIDIGLYYGMSKDNLDELYISDDDIERFRLYINNEDNKNYISIYNNNNIDNMIDNTKEYITDINKEILIKNKKVKELEKLLLEKQKLEILNMKLDKQIKDLEKVLNNTK